MGHFRPSSPSAPEPRLGLLRGRLQRRRQERPGHRGLRRQHRERAARQRQWYVSGQAVLRHRKHADSVAVGDFNGDGKSDLVTADDDGNTASVLLGNGNGTFQAKQSFGTGDAA